MLLLNVEDIIPYINQGIMYNFFKESIKDIALIFLLIVLTHGLFFMCYGYCMSGNPFIALGNFYEIMYNIRL